MTKKILSLSAIALAMSVSFAPVTHAHGDYDQMRTQILSQLDLTADQQTKVDAIKALAKETIKPLHAQLRAIRAQIHAAYQTGTMDESKIDGFVNQQKDIMGPIIKTRMMQRLAVYNILTTEQKAKLETLIQQWKEKRAQEKLDKSDDSND